MADERKILTIEVQTGESGKRVAEVDAKLTSLREELTKAQLALKTFKAENKDQAALVANSAEYQRLEGNVKKLRSEYGRLQNDQQGIKSNTSGLTNALKEAAKEIGASLAAQLDKAQNALQEYMTTAKATSGAVDEQSEEYRALQAEVQRLTTEYGQLQAKQQSSEESTAAFTGAITRSSEELKAGIVTELKRAQDALQQYLDSNKDLGPIVRQTAEFQKLEKQLEDVQQEYLKLDKQQASLKSTSSQISSAVGSVALKFTAGIAAVKGIASAVGGAVAAYNEAERTSKALTVALGHESQALLDQADAMERKTLFDAESAKAAQTTLALYDLEEAQIKELLPVIADFAEAKQMGLAEAAEVVGKSITTSTNMLGRYGVSIEGAVGSSERFESAITTLSDKFNGFTTSAAEVGTGPLKVFGQVAGQIEESLGSLTVGIVNEFLPSLSVMAKDLASLAEIRLSEQFEEDRISLLALSSELQATNTSTERRSQIITELQSKYPAYFSNLDKERASNDQIKTAVEATNRALLAKIAIQQAQEEVDQTASLVAQGITTQVKQETQLRKILGDVYDRNNARFQESNDLVADAKSTLEKYGDSMGFFERRELQTLIRMTESVAKGTEEHTQQLDAQQKFVEDVRAKFTDLANTIQDVGASTNSTTNATDNSTAAWLKQGHSIDQLNDKLGDLKKAIKDADGNQAKTQALQREIDAVEAAIKAYKRKEQAETDATSFNAGLKTAEQSRDAQLAITAQLEEAKTIRTQEAEQRRLEIAKAYADQRLQLATDYAAKGGYTVKELADLTALQTNAKAAEQAQQKFLSKLEEQNKKEESIFSFHFDQLSLQTQLDQQLAAYDAFAAAKAEEDQKLGLSDAQVTANEKTRAAERLRIQQQGQTAILQSQLAFVEAQASNLQRIKASYQPLNEEQQKQLDDLLAKAQSIRQAILQTSVEAAPEEGPSSVLGKLFHISDDEAAALTDQAISFANQLGSTLLDIERQQNAQRLEDTTNRVNSQYQVEVDSLKARNEAGLLSDAEFEEQRKALEDKKNAQLLAAKQKAFKANQKAAISEVLINTAVAITAAFRRAGTPIDKIIEAAGYAATGALQIIKIKSEKPPEFKRGGQLPGRVLLGPRHEAGGVPIYADGGQTPFAVAEGGEYITSRSATERYLPILEAMNRSTRTTPRVAALESVANTVSPLNQNNQPSEIRAYVVEADITRSQQRISKIDQKAEIGE